MLPSNLQGEKKKRKKKKEIKREKQGRACSYLGFSSHLKNMQDEVT